MLGNNKRKLAKFTLSCCASSMCALSCIAFPVFSIYPTIDPGFQVAYNTIIGATCSTLISQLVGLFNTPYYENNEALDQNVITEQPTIRSMPPTYQEVNDLPSYEEAIQNNSSDNSIALNISVIPAIHTSRSNLHN